MHAAKNIKLIVHASAVCDVWNVQLTMTTLIHLSDTQQHVTLHVLKIASTRTNNSNKFYRLYYTCVQLANKILFFTRFLSLNI